MRRGKRSEVEEGECMQLVVQSRIQNVGVEGD